MTADHQIAHAPVVKSDVGDKGIGQPSDPGDHSGDDLSRYVFKNPQDFLQTLGKVDHKIANVYGDVSLSNLASFSLDTKNPTDERAAAFIGMVHYDDLGKLAEAKDQSEPYSRSWLTTSTTDTLLNYENGTTGWSKFRATAMDATETAVAAVGTAALGVATVLDVENPAVVPLGAATVAAGGMTAYLGDKTYNDGKAIDTASANTKTTLGKWDEINGRSQPLTLDSESD